jgi:hypothetical protein
MNVRLDATIELATALAWAATQADIAAAAATAAGSTQDAADKAGYALDLHLAAADVLLAVRRSRLAGGL